MLSNEWCSTMEWTVECMETGRTVAMAHVEQRRSGRDEREQICAGFSWRDTKRWNPLALHRHENDHHHYRKLVYRRQLLNLICAQLCRFTEFEAAAARFKHNTARRQLQLRQQQQQQQHKNAFVHPRLASRKVFNYSELRTVEHVQALPLRYPAYATEHDVAQDELNTAETGAART